MVKRIFGIESALSKFQPLVAGVTAASQKWAWQMHLKMPISEIIDFTSPLCSWETGRCDCYSQWNFGFLWSKHLPCHRESHLYFPVLNEAMMLRYLWGERTLCEKDYHLCGNFFWISYLLHLVSVVSYNKLFWILIMTTLEGQGLPTFITVPMHMRVPRGYSEPTETMKYSLPKMLFLLIASFTSHHDMGTVLFIAWEYRVRQIIERS